MIIFFPQIFTVQKFTVRFLLSMYLNILPSALHVVCVCSACICVFVPFFFGDHHEIYLGHVPKDEVSCLSLSEVDPSIMLVLNIYKNEGINSHLSSYMTPNASG